MQNCKIYSIYTHSSPEIPIGDLPVTITYMAIDLFEISGNKASARGNVSIMDYIENCPGDDPWVATGILRGESFCWTVLRKTPSGDDFCFCSKGGEPLFTLSEPVNRAIKEFIVSKLKYVVAGLQQNPSATRIVDEKNGS